MWSYPVRAPEVAVLLSTYNGERYLSAQLESIAGQTQRDWILRARDDGSRDNSVEILLDFQRRFPEKVVISSGDNIGPTRSFGELIEASNEPYLMFCDQDDVWHTNKIELMARRMAILEEAYGIDCPLLVFSDLRIIDRNGVDVEGSFWRRHGIDPRHACLRRLILQNVVTGCASMFNRALARAATPFPDRAVLHDWWVALNAAALGHLSDIGEPTVDYRIHAENLVGARPIGWGRAASYASAPRQLKRRMEEIYRITSAQVASLLDKHSALATKDQELLRGYLDAVGKGAGYRKAFMLRERVLFSSWLRNVCLFAF